MPRPLVIAINGILTLQSKLSWCDEFDAWCLANSVPVEVRKREYFAHVTPFLNVWFWNRIYARGIAAEVECIRQRVGQELEIHFVAHSNGTDIALKAIKLLAAKGIATKTFIAIGSVLKPDILSTGIAQLIESRMLNRAVAYASESDTILRLGNRFSVYSNLGRRGFNLNGADVNRILRYAPLLSGNRMAEGDCFTRWFPGYGHGHYFTKDADATFALIRKDMGL